MFKISYEQRKPLFGNGTCPMDVERPICYSTHGVFPMKKEISSLDLHCDMANVVAAYHRFIDRDVFDFRESPFIFEKDMMASLDMFVYNVPSTIGYTPMKLHLLISTKCLPNTGIPNEYYAIIVSHILEKYTATHTFEIEVTYEIFWASYTDETRQKMKSIKKNTSLSKTSKYRKLHQFRSLDDHCLQIAVTQQVRDGYDPEGILIASNDKYRDAGQHMAPFNCNGYLIDPDHYPDVRDIISGIGRVEVDIDDDKYLDLRIPMDTL